MILAVPPRGYHPDEPRQFLGYWSSQDSPSLPHPADYVDGSWDPGPLADRLRLGTTLKSWKGYSTCRLCGARNGSRCFTFDGSYVWPEGLAHYLEVHRVRPPQVFEDYALSLPTPLMEELQQHALSEQRFLAEYRAHQNGEGCSHSGCVFQPKGYPLCLVKFPLGGSWGGPSCFQAGETLREKRDLEQARHQQALRPFVDHPWWQP